MTRSILAAATAVLLAGPALAQERPPLAPTRDVTVDYIEDANSSGPAPGGKLRVMARSGGARVRVEPAQMPGYLVVERATGRILMVMTQQHMYLELPGDPARTRMFTFNKKMRFTRKGGDSVAGQRCTVWNVQDGARSSVACITDDGVLLRGETKEGGKTSGLTATAVTYAPLAEALFQPPADFRKMDIPAAVVPGQVRPAAPAR